MLYFRFDTLSFLSLSLFLSRSLSLSLSHLSLFLSFSLSLFLSIPLSLYPPLSLSLSPLSLYLSYILTPTPLQCNKTSGFLNHSLLVCITQTIILSILFVYIYSYICYNNFIFGLKYYMFVSKSIVLCILLLNLDKAGILT